MKKRVLPPVYFFISIIAVFAIMMDIVFINVEEKMLDEKFAQSWREYKQKTRRWI